MKSKFFLIIITALVALAGCKKDNRKEPESKITGRVVFQSQPLGLRSNGVQLELWQKGYQLFNKIPVYIAQDGTFSAAVFDGDYLLTRLTGNGPWADNTDSISVQVNGTATIDVPVDPYFVIKNESIQKSDTNITATFNLQNVNTSKNLELVRIYVGKTLITDQNNNDANAKKLAADITDLSQPVTLSVKIPAALADKDYLYARIGVKTLDVGELLYTQSQKIVLK
jgi:Protein of unknown function (DUF3823) N-terminal domain/Domain of unknown function (DUF3823_C)